MSIISFWWKNAGRERNANDESCNLDCCFWMQEHARGTNPSLAVIALEVGDWMWDRVPGCGLQRCPVDRSASPHWLLAGHGWCYSRVSAQVRGSFSLWWDFYRCKRNWVFCFENSSSTGLALTLDNFTQLSHKESRDIHLGLCWMELNIMQLKQCF